MLLTLVLTLPSCMRSPRLPSARADIETESSRLGAEGGDRPRWRQAIVAADWPAAVSALDRLPEPERAAAGARYARALAEQQLGHCDRAIAALEGLADELSPLRDEIQAIERVCLLAERPFDEEALLLARQVPLDDRLELVRRWQRNGRLDEASRLLNDLLEELPERRGRRDAQERARQLRAELSEELGLPLKATDDYRWLATTAIAPGADVAFERVSGARLTAAERARRAEALADRGAVSAVRRELELMRRAPGRAPSQVKQVRTLARATYRSRSDDVGAARLYERAWRLSRRAHASDAFRAARAWTRARRVEPAVALYAEILRRHAGTPAAERALYATAYAYYVNGRWSEAVRGYSAYLRRHARSRRSRFVVASRYERAISELVLGNGSAAFAAFERLRRGPHTSYRTSLLEHLAAVSLATTGEAANESAAVERFERVATRYPLSFAALASAARLERMGREPPRLEPLPAVNPELDAWDELPEKVRLLADLGLETAAERALSEAEPSIRRRYAPRGGQTLCHQYGALHSGYRRYSLATGVARRGILERPPTASNLWIWQCLHPLPYVSGVARLEQRYQLPAGLIHSVMRQESAFRADARSAAGAVGLMQLMPATAQRAAAELALEHRNEKLVGTSYNLELGAFYLNKLLGSFDRRVALALASYNAGPHAAFRWLAGDQPVPLDVWAARIPFKETRHYVQRVMASWARYRYLSGGPEQVPRLALGLPRGLEPPLDIY